MLFPTPTTVSHAAADILSLPTRFSPMTSSPSTEVPLLHHLLSRITDVIPIMSTWKKGNAGGSTAQPALGLAVFLSNVFFFVFLFSSVCMDCRRPRHLRCPEEKTYQSFLHAPRSSWRDIPTEFHSRMLVVILIVVILFANEQNASSCRHIVQDTEETPGFVPSFSLPPRSRDLDTTVLPRAQISWLRSYLWSSMVDAHLDTFPPGTTLTTNNGNSPYTHALRPWMKRSCSVPLQSSFLDNLPKRTVRCQRPIRKGIKFPPFSISYSMHGTVGRHVLGPAFHI